jgi:hypothetical protein
MNAMNESKPLPLRERFFLFRPVVLGNPIVRMLVLLAVLATVVSVALNSKRVPQDPFAMPVNAPPVKIDEVPRDFLYNIPKGQLDSMARPDFAERWGSLAHGMAALKVHPWAGKYVRAGDVLLVAPRGGFVAVIDTQDSGVTQHHYLVGKLKAESGRLDLTPDGRDTAHVPLPATLYAVQWGNRHYLLTDMEWKHQAEALVKTGKPDMKALGAVFIRAGDQAAKAGDAFPLPTFAD